MAILGPSAQNPLGLHPGRQERVRVKVRGGDVKIGTIGQFEIDGNDAAVTAALTFGGSTDPTANTIASIAAEGLNTNNRWNIYCVYMEDISDDGEGWAVVRGVVPLAWDAASDTVGGAGTPGVAAGLISLVSANAERVVAIALETTILYVSGSATTRTTCIFDGIYGFGQFNA
jgi:hypothetical protein